MQTKYEISDCPSSKGKSCIENLEDNVFWYLKQKEQSVDSE